MSSINGPSVGLLFALAAGGLAAAPSEENATPLEPIIVTPKINPLDANMERLRKTLDDCSGCGPLLEADRESIYDKTYYGVGAVLSFLSGMPEKPFNLTPEERVEAHIAGDWRQYEREPER